MTAATGILVDWYTGIPFSDWYIGGLVYWYFIALGVLYFTFYYSLS